MYNYYEAIKEDIICFLEEEYTEEEILEKLEDLEEWEEELQDFLQDEDAITGNMSGSYTFNRWDTREYVIENLDILEEAAQEFCISSDEIGDKFLSGNFEWFDVIIRVYLLPSIIGDAITELKEEMQNK